MQLNITVSFNKSYRMTLDTESENVDAKEHFCKFWLKY